MHLIESNWDSCAMLPGVIFNNNNTFFFLQNIHIFKQSIYIFPTGLYISVRFFSHLSILVSLPTIQLNHLVFSEITTQWQIQVL
jgi:hypothetical protein